MSDKLPNPLSSGGSGSSSSDFLAFSTSTTSTPRQDKFKPQRGKANRQANWQRFGQFERGGGNGNRARFNSPQPNRGSQNNSPHFYSTPNWTEGPSQRGWRGSPGNFRGGSGGRGGFTPRGDFGGRGGFTPRGDSGGRGSFTPRGHGGGRQNRGNNSNNSGSYFHPSMLEDPWASLYQRDKYEHGDDVNADTSLSDSLMPQVGDSIINIAPDVPDNLDQDLNQDATQDLSKYSFNSDNANVESENQTREMTLSEELNCGKVAMSDSMIPLVGDSILERNNEEV